MIKSNVVRALSGTLLMFVVAACDDPIDDCLDSGGKWDAEAEQCICEGSQQDGQCDINEVQIDNLRASERL